MSNIMDFWKNEWDEVTSTDDLFDDPDPLSQVLRSRLVSNILEVY